MSETAPQVLPKGDDTQELIDRIGQLTRALHESMRELGLDKEVEKAAEAIPDARDRLAYIANTTEAAAERALSAIEVARPLQEDIERQASRLTDRWNDWFDAPVALEHARTLVADTRGYLQWLPEQTQATNAQLREIMMAQDFQDLTGQVIKKLVEVIRRIEQQLVQVLLDNRAAEHRHGASGERQAREGKTLVNGPQIKVAGNTEVVADQAQVDDLLDSLGF
jgi:chemotaxis protein CheZ